MQVEKVQIYIYSFHTLLPLELHNASKSSVNNMSVTTMICYQLFVVWNSAFHKIGNVYDQQQWPIHFIAL